MITGACVWGVLEEEIIMKNHVTLDINMNSYYILRKHEKLLKSFKEKEEALITYLLMHTPYFNLFFLTSSS